MVQLCNALLHEINSGLDGGPERNTERNYCRPWGVPVGRLQIPDENECPQEFVAPENGKEKADLPDLPIKGPVKIAK